MAAIYGFTLERLQGGALPLESFRGRPLIIVNTASKCGFTPQYAGLEALWRTHEKDGLVILGIPCDDFGHQEPGGPDEIAEFCQVNYGVSFPMAGKVHVKGKEAHPLFSFLREECGALAAPRWNFYKYLVSREGQVVDWFASTTAPDSPKFRKAVERLVHG